MTFPGNYDLQPTVAIDDDVLAGDAAWAAIRALEADRATTRVAFDAYPGLDLVELRAAIADRLPDHEIVDVEALAARSAEELAALLAPHLTDDRVFGVMGHHRVTDFYDADRLAEVRELVAGADRPVAVIGWGSAQVVDDDAVVVLGSMARWEIQLRYRDGMPNWRAENGDEDPLRKIKRGYFVEWRAADRHKVDMLYRRADLVWDGNRSQDDARALTAAAFHRAMGAITQRPFRVLPYFDPGVWGGQWMREALGLPDGPPNYAWAFDCVPEENAVLLSGGGATIQLPAIDVVLTQPRALLGERTHARFGPEFPIRFDFLDTMGGGNLSLQVHPLTGYIQDRFGMAYTQDESYYFLDAGDDACIWLGLVDGVDPAQVEHALRTAATGAEPFDAARYVNRIPAARHDHFSIPAGTVHCSGKDALVLEISATPYCFTFKLWDWGRVGLDGVPRPIHLDHGLRNIQWERDSGWIERLEGPQPVDAGDGWRQERTGLDELEFIEVRRHWFTAPTDRDTEGTVHVLNLVQGTAAVVSSPDGAFADFEVHYAETFIVPAAVGRYTVAPPAGTDEELATVTAWVRDTRVSR